MIVGIGIDTVSIDRIAQALRIPGFIDETFTKAEIKNKHGDIERYYATRFACKEAVFKAVGCPMDWRLIEVLNYDNGKPYVSNDEYKNLIVHISLTIEENFVTAFCVVEKG